MARKIVLRLAIAGLAASGAALAGAGAGTSAPSAAASATAPARTEPADAEELRARLEKALPGWTVAVQALADAQGRPAGLRFRGANPALVIQPPADGQTRATFDIYLHTRDAGEPGRAGPALPATTHARSERYVLFGDSVLPRGAFAQRDAIEQAAQEVLLDLTNWPAGRRETDLASLPNLAGDLQGDNWGAIDQAVDALARLATAPAKALLRKATTLQPARAALSATIALGQVGHAAMAGDLLNVMDRPDSLEVLASNPYNVNLATAAHYALVQILGVEPERKGRVEIDGPDERRALRAFWADRLATSASAPTTAATAPHERPASP